MVKQLAKLKETVDKNLIHFGIVKADNIQALSRYRNKSKATWLLASVRFGSISKQLKCILNLSIFFRMVRL